MNHAKLPSIYVTWQHNTFRCATHDTWQFNTLRDVASHRATLPQHRSSRLDNMLQGSTCRHATPHYNNAHYNAMRCAATPRVACYYSATPHTTTHNISRQLARPICVVSQHTVPHNAPSVRWHASRRVVVRHAKPRHHAWQRVATRDTYRATTHGVTARHTTPRRSARRAPCAARRSTAHITTPHIAIPRRTTPTASQHNAAQRAITHRATPHHTATRRHTPPRNTSRRATTRHGAPHGHAARLATPRNTSLATLHHNTTQHNTRYQRHQHNHTAMSPRRVATQRNTFAPRS